jgi:hypothetical protein
MATRVQILWGVLGAVIFGLAFVIFAISTCAKAVLNNANLTDPDQPSYTAAESHRKGIWVSDVELSPQEMNWKGNTVAFNEVWVEHQSKLEHHAVWFPYYKTLDGYFLCFTVKSGEGMLYWLGDSGASFTARSGSGATLFFKRVDDYTALETMRIRIANRSDQEAGSVAIKLRH